MEVLMIALQHAFYDVLLDSDGVLVLGRSSLAVVSLLIITI